MAGYVIANVEVRDVAGYEEYRGLVPATIEKYGGKYLVRGGKHEVRHAAGARRRNAADALALEEARDRLLEPHGVTRPRR